MYVLIFLPFQNNLQRNLSGGPGGKGPEFVIQGQDGTMTILPNVYKTNLEHTGQPVMVTLNPYSSQLVDNLNRMMKEEEDNAATMNPQLARLTATLRKKRCELGHPGPCRPTCGFNENTLQMADRSSRLINPTDVVFRAVSPHGHVYWEINPKEGQQVMVGKPKSATSSGDENTNTSDLQNVSDFSDSDDHRAHSEMSRQSSSRFSESRPLIYTSSASTSPGHSNGSHAHIDAARQQLDAASNFHAAATTAQRAKFGRGAVSGRWPTLPPNFHEEVYAYAATDFGHQGSVPETVQSQVQIKDLRTLPVTVKSKEYIMAKIADYTERNIANQV